MCPRARFIVKIHFLQNGTWLLPPFCSLSNGDNSANIEQIGTNFYRETDSRVLEHVLPSKFLFNKIHYGGGRHIKIRIYGHHLATFHEIVVVVVNAKPARAVALLLGDHDSSHASTDPPGELHYPSGPDRSISLVVGPLGGRPRDRSTWQWRPCAPGHLDVVSQRDRRGRYDGC